MQINIDKILPTVIIEASEKSPTTASSITYTFTFSEEVTGFTQDDIQVTNGTKGTFSGSGKTYTLVVTQNQSSTQTVQVLQGVCTDSVLNPNIASNIVSIEINRRQNLTINSNGGAYNGNTSVTTISQDPGTKYSLANPTPPSGYTVTFNGNGGTAETSNVKSSKSFSGWSHTSGAGSLSGNTFTFGESEGTVAANYLNGSVTLAKAQRTGYTFTGWYDSAGKYVGTQGSTYIPTENITLYARMANSYI